MPVTLGTGATVTFATSSFTANVTDIGISGLSRESIDTSHLGTTANRTFMPGSLVDAGELEMEIQFDPDNYPPIAAAAETITITFPLSSAGTTEATWAATGFATGFTAGVTLEELMTGTLTVKFSGAITSTDEV